MVINNSKIVIEVVEYLPEIEAIKTIRTQVFQVEQGIAKELEFDGKDESATHLLAYLGHQPVGTARIRKLNKKTAKIERLSVLRPARRKGIGQKLMAKAIEFATSQNYHTVIVNAQKYIKSLYQELGFEQVGNVFEEANIPHVKMTKKLDKNNSSSQKTALPISDKKNDSQLTNSSTGDDHPQFQAVGIIKGEVKFHNEEKQVISVTIGNKEYGIHCATRHFAALSGLKKEIAKTGKTTQRLIVYPKVMHFPKRDEPHRLWFQLIGFEVGNYKNSISQDLKDNEFKICGLWQFIPVCRPPCISVFLNFKQERLDILKASDNPATNAKFMKTNHIPVLWRDSPIRPFRYNRLGGKEQGHPMFVQVKAVFLPERDAFAFVEQLGETTEQAPRFIKLPKSAKPQGNKQFSQRNTKNLRKKAKSNLSPPGKSK